MSSGSSAPAGPGVPTIVLVDGRASHEPWVLDRGFHFGDGLFETISCRAGRPRFLSLHLERLMEGCRRLHLPSLDVEVLRSEVRQLAEGDAGIVKVIVTRGQALARGYGFTGRERATRVLLRYPAAPAGLPSGVRVDVAMLRLGENPALAGLKHLNRLEQILAWREREERGLDELLLLSRSGALVSGIMSNLFLARRGTLATPAIDLCGVAGIMRQVVLREAGFAGIVCEERTLERADLDEADEVFLTSSRIGVAPVISVGPRSLGVGAMTRRVQGLIAPMLENPVDE